MLRCPTTKACSQLFCHVSVHGHYVWLWLICCMLFPPTVFMEVAPIKLEDSAIPLLRAILSLVSCVRKGSNLPVTACPAVRCLCIHGTSWNSNQQVVTAAAVGHRVTIRRAPALPRSPFKQLCASFHTLNTAVVKFCNFNTDDGNSLRQIKWTSRWEPGLTS